jgi:NADH:ubiquinone oxidoreductase subunit F (NADH-binding)
MAATDLGAPAAGRAVGGPRNPPWLLPSGAAADDHLRTVGPLPRHGPEIISLIEASGLRGRGGAGFPTAHKLAAVERRPGRHAVLANGTEGEPLSGKDAALITHAPHLVLDGMAVAAAAVSAESSIVCVEAGRHDLVAVLKHAVLERRDPVRVEILQAPARYVTGQETALVSWVGGGEAKPTGRRPDRGGIGGQPTLVDNVETLANLALIARFGPSWYRSVGLAGDPGTRLVSISGSVERPGIYEIPTGYLLADLLRRSGARHPRAVLLGGYSGRWVRPGDSGLIVDSSNLGAGVIVVVDDTICALHEVAGVAKWFSASSARQCGACEFGLADIAEATEKLEQGAPTDAETDLHRWTHMIRGRGACHLPDGAADFISTALDVFADEIAEHRHRACNRPRGALLPTPRPEPWR